MKSKAVLFPLWLVFVLGTGAVFAQEQRTHPIVGNWLINEELSDDPDEAVEAAIIRAGGRVSRSWFKKKERGRYRGGPAEQEVYDRLSYDTVLRIAYDEPEFWFGYADGFQRVFHSDGRTRSVGASEHYSNGAVDFTMAQWEGDTLVVEGRPREGGFTLEFYTLENDDSRLRVELELKPNNFGAAVKMVRVYDRQSP